MYAQRNLRRDSPKLTTPSVGSSVEELAKKKGVSMAQIAVAWVLAKPHVTAPIVGTTSLDNLEDILGASVCSPESRKWCLRRG